MKTEIEPLEVAALVLAGRLPLRETVKLYDGAVVIRTVAKRESEPDLRAINREQIQVSVKFLDRLNAEIQLDKQTIRELREALEDCLAPLQLHQNECRSTLAAAAFLKAKRAIEKTRKQTT